MLEQDKKNYVLRTKIAVALMSGVRKKEPKMNLRNEASQLFGIITIAFYKPISFQLSFIIT